MRSPRPLRALAVCILAIGVLHATQIVSSRGQLPPAKSASGSSSPEPSPQGTGAATPPKWRLYPNQ